MYIFECLYLKYVLQKRKLDRDKKGAKHKHWKQKQNKTCACELYLFVILIRALFQRLLLTKFQESVKPKNKFTGISFEFKQKSLEFKKKSKKTNLIKSDQIWWFDQIWSDLIRFDFSVFFDIVWFFLNSSEFFLVSQVFFLYVFNSNHFFGFNANWLCWIPVKFWLKNWSNLSCQVVFRIYGT